MTRAELRLELLKLSYTHGRDVAEAVGRAEKMEEFILQGSELNKESSGGVKPILKVKKDSGNADELFR